MSALAWLFGLGILGVGFPIVFHLIRRAPTDHKLFSSLIFLEVSPPRLTQRSRIDEWLLLLLRSLVIALLAMAFMRPLWRGFVDGGTSAGLNRATVILVDQSASMRRGDLWTDVQRAAAAVVADLEAGERIGLFSFDDELYPHVPWEVDGSESGSTGLAGGDGVRQALQEIKPTFRGTDLGNALVRIADEYRSYLSDKSSRPDLRIVVISDLQQGTELGELENYDWPADLVVEFKLVGSEVDDNFSVIGFSEVATEREDQAADGPQLRLRVAAGDGAVGDRVRLSWGSAATEALQGLTVPITAGRSQSVTVERPAEVAAEYVEVSGDDCDFDNRWYVAPPTRRELQVGLFGQGAPGDAQSQFYFWSRALQQSELRKFVYREWPLAENRSEPSLTSTPFDLLLVHLANSSNDPTSSVAWGELETYLNSGGVALVTLATDELPADWTRGLGIEPVAQRGEKSTGKTNNFNLWVDIDFRHPLFQPLNAPQFRDFTKVHFWTAPHWRIVDENSVQLLARYDDRRPALWEVPRNVGRLLVLNGSWRPDDSQLALSSKFVLFCEGVLGLVPRAEESPRSIQVGMRWPIPSAFRSAGGKIYGPGGEAIDVPIGVPNAGPWERPGVYRFQSGEDYCSFAVNLPPIESKLGRLPRERLASLGVNLQPRPTASEAELERQKLRDQEVESQQKLWKWLIMAALIGLAAESWVLLRKPAIRVSESATS